MVSWKIPAPAKGSVCAKTGNFSLNPGALPGPFLALPQPSSIPLLLLLQKGGTDAPTPHPLPLGALQQ